MISPSLSSDVAPTEADLEELYALRFWSFGFDFLLFCCCCKFLDYLLPIFFVFFLDRSGSYLGIF